MWHKMAIHCITVEGSAKLQYVALIHVLFLCLLSNIDIEEFYKLKSYFNQFLFLKDVMKLWPLFFLLQSKLKDNVTELGTILEHETMDFTSSSPPPTTAPSSPPNPQPSSSPQPQCSTPDLENLHALPL